MTRTRWFNLATLSLLASTLAACGGDDDPEPTATIAPTVAVATAQPTSAVVTGSTASDGVCRVTVPDDWIDIGTGRGTTTQGDRWSLFGGSIAGDAAWTSAKELLRTQMNNLTGAEIMDEGDRIVVTTPDGRRFIVRQRFESRYCELSLSSSREVAVEEQAVWLEVAATLAPVARE